MLFRMWLVGIAILATSAGISFADSFHSWMPKDGEVLLYHHQGYDTQSDQGKVLRTRLRLTWAPANSWGGQVYLEGRHLVSDQMNPNWLLDAYVSYAFSPATRVRVGRIFLAAMFQTPAPHTLRTVRYLGSDPYGVYAYGIQMKRQFGVDQQWKLITDIAGNSNRDFDDPAQFERGEASFFLERQGTVTWNVGGQASQDFIRLGVGAAYALSERLSLHGTGYDDSSREEAVTGFVTLEVQASSWLTPRVSVEHDVTRHRTLIPGILLHPCKYFWFTAERGRDAYAARIQVRL